MRELPLTSGSLIIEPLWASISCDMVQMGCDSVSSSAFCSVTAKQNGKQKYDHFISTMYIEHAVDATMYSVQLCHFMPFPFGRICFVVLVMRKGGGSS